jgi:transposase
MALIMTYILPVGKEFPREVNMSRPKVLLDAATIVKAEESLATIKEAKLVIQLKAILATRDHRVEDVASILRVSHRSIFRWIHRFQDGGVKALRDRPRGHRRAKLNEEQKAAVEQWVVGGTTADGKPVLWTVEKLRLAIAKEFGVSMAKTPLWLLLRKMNLVPRRPRPRHAKADPAAQAAFKKTSRKARRP